MNIYERDYTSLTDEEIKEWDSIKNQESTGRVGKVSNLRNYPKAIRHYRSLFPNNYMDFAELQNEQQHLVELVNSFSSLLNDTSITERTILNFIREKKAYFLIASILHLYRFGHHDAFIFPEFQLGNSYQADFLIVGKRSGGYEFIFVELEHPYKNILLADGNLGNAFRKGLIQITDWKVWLEEYFSSLSETFEKYKNSRMQLEREFLKFDSSRYHYVVVAGRRTDFQINAEKTYRLQREHLKDNIQLLHYDNILDCARIKIGQATY